MFTLTLIYEGTEYDLGLATAETEAELREAVVQGKTFGMTVTQGGRRTTIPPHILQRSILISEGVDDADIEPE